ncbi:MAG: 2-succinyl-5-enolpyruvyl-6-hydroxy-3-cyclohexene-1-carboxylic-acid synthase [Chlorobiaceae bacterium]|nr:2-succinyl-5-enolpyruvyl-6-hydroxy-3-cyclohexene-1-carboxylic-acid synthase [Chlorobiaceae bacterium]NTV59715.1 2-succinyl-5-enolpyruvyl-6-hydroxy-3-cyclohexene-1-carboxylic-acid synthase [Chlorobiaceae bacterium]
MNSRGITSLWSTVITEELVRQGADFFCISPGSRSTPLTVAVARNPKTRWKIFPDERSAGFFALGYAKATGKPAVLICTSGTAVANYYPAVVEASLDFRPMVVLSADRPFELLDCGANQTIRQENMFGSFTRWNMQLPAPSKEVPLASLLSAAAYAVSKATGSPAGPVHLNQPFREPLEPEVPDYSDPWFEPLRSWHETGHPSTMPVFPEKQPDTRTLSLLRRLIGEARQPFLIAGNLTDIADARAIEELAADLQVPLYADLSSGLRLSNATCPWQLAMQSPEFRKRFRPDVVLHFGGHIISRHPAAALSEWKPEHLVVFRNHPNRFSPVLNVTMSVEGSLAQAANMLKGCRKRTSSFDIGRSEEFFRQADLEIEKETHPGNPVTEISAARIVSRFITPGEALFLSNSMPVRDMDSYACTLSSNGINIGLNRGASGIDGIISTAAGFAEGNRKPLTLLIGDIAFLHDMNALTLPSKLSVPLKIIVLNNNGGGIFSFLPVSGCTDVFETHFATPQNFSVRLAAETFGLRYASPSTNREFADIYTAASSDSQSIVIEIKGTRKSNLEQHRDLQARIATHAARHFTAL